MPKEKTVVVSVNEEEVKVTLRSLKSGEVEDAMREAGMNFDFKENRMVGDFWAYTRRLVAKSIVAPKSLQSVNALRELDDTEYQKLRTAYTEVAGMTKPEKDFLPKR